MGVHYSVIRLGKGYSMSELHCPGTIICTEDDQWVPYLCEVSESSWLLLQPGIVPSWYALYLIYQTVCQCHALSCISTAAGFVGALVFQYVSI